MQGGFRARLLSPVVGFAVRRPWTTLLLTAVVCALAVWAGSRLQLKVRRDAFLSPDDPAVRSYKAYVDEFGGLNAVFVIVDAPPAEARAFAEEAGQAISTKLASWVRSVTYKVDLARYEEQGLWLQSPERLDEVNRDLVDAGPVLRRLCEAPNLATLLSAVAEQMGDEEETPRPVPDVIADLGSLRTAMGALRKAAEGAKESELAVLPGLRKGRPSLAELHLDEDGHLTSRDGRLRLIVINPSKQVAGDEVTRAFRKDLDEALAPAFAKHPQVKVFLAGGPIRESEESATVSRDLRLTSAISMIGVSLMLWVAYGSLPPVAILMITLVICVTLTVGGAYLIVGHLNLVSSVFVAILFGLGDDFGTYIIMQALKGAPKGGEEAVREAGVRVGTSVLTAALTIALAFYSLGFHELVPFRELGWIAGTGILLTYLCMITVLPALLTLHVRRSARRGTLAAEAAVGSEKMGSWLVGIARHPLPVLVLTGVTVALLAPFATGNAFEFDLRQLLPTGQASDAEKMLSERFGVSSDFNVVLSKDLAEVHRIHAALKAAPTVARVESLSPFMPRDLDKKKELVGRIKDQMDGMPPVPLTGAGGTVASVLEGLSALEKSQGRLKTLASMSESQPLTDEIAKLSSDIAATRSVLMQVPSTGSAPVLELTDRVLRREVVDWRRFLSRAAAAEPNTLAKLPPELKSRFVGAQGTFVTYVTPKSDLSREEDSAAFYTDCSKIAPTATGLPTLVYHTMSMIKSGWLKAAGWLLLAIFVMVAIDFKEPRRTVLALLPLACGTCVMAAGLTLVGVKWNAINTVALPILLGVGVDYGVNLLHGWAEEGSLDEALLHNGPSIVWAALTTGMGFGSLACAQHRGLGSFGLTLLFGILACLAAALIVVPAAAWAMGLTREARQDTPPTPNSPPPV